MLALEDTFDIEFPDNLLNRKSFSTIAMIEQVVAQLVAGKEGRLMDAILNPRGATLQSAPAAFGKCAVQQSKLMM